MSFYIRKSVSVGPFRFNLSNSGIGVSAGIPGFRVGTGPRGNYIHMGRGGLYYRASSGPTRLPSRRLPSPVVQPSGNAGIGPMVDVEVGDALALVPANAQDILRQINEKAASLPLWPFILGLGIFAAWFANSAGLATQYVTLAGGGTVIGALVAGYFDKLRRCVVVMYDLDKGVEDVYAGLAREFEKIIQCHKIWNIKTSAQVHDWKRNANAGYQVERTQATAGFGAPPFIKSNIAPPCILGGRHNLYFFPDVILVIEGKKVGAMTYRDIGIDFGSTVFIEDQGVPADSQVVGHTWRFVNKNGGPDRRFNNNRQIPKAVYQIMLLTGPNDFQKILHLSKTDDRQEILLKVAKLRAASANKETLPAS